MAVHLPSDLVADVLRNADPSRREAAVSRLRSMVTNPASGFAGVVEAAGTHLSGQAVNVADEGVQGAGSQRVQAGGQNDARAYRGFEQMVLRNLFESLLPNEESGAFGDGPSAGVWRSMAADQLAGVYTNSGGIGLQAMLAPVGGQHGPRREAGWPYFSVGGISLLRD